MPVLACCAVAVALLFSVTVRAQEKEQRTPAQQKIDSQLLYEIYRARGEAERKGVPPGPTGVRIDRRGRALVELRAAPTTSLLKAIRGAHGQVLSFSTQYRSIIARVPLLEIEDLAARAGVEFIQPAPEAITGPKSQGGVR